MCRYIGLFLLVCAVVASTPGVSLARIVDGRAILHQKSEGNMCAVTFDDGPSNFTSQLLDSLQAEGVHATFFVLGRQVARHPDLVRRMLAEGHEVGSHSYSHPNFRKLSEGDQWTQLALTDKLLRDLGANPRSFRPPYGNYTETTTALAQDFGMSIVLWSSDSMDWKRRPADYSQMRTVTGLPSLPGMMHGVFLFHDIRKGTVEDLPLIIATLRQGGCERFVTVAEYMNYDGVEPPLYTKLPTDTDPATPGVQPAQDMTLPESLASTGSPANVATMGNMGNRGDMGNRGSQPASMGTGAVVTGSPVQGPVQALDGTVTAKATDSIGLARPAAGHAPLPAATETAAAPTEHPAAGPEHPDLGPGDVPLARSSQPWPWMLFHRSGT